MPSVRWRGLDVSRYMDLWSWGRYILEGATSVGEGSSWSEGCIKDHEGSIGIDVII